MLKMLNMLIYVVKHYVGTQIIRSKLLIRKVFIHHLLKIEKIMNTHTHLSGSLVSAVEGGPLSLVAQEHQSPPVQEQLHQRDVPPPHRLMQTRVPVAIRQIHQRTALIHITGVEYQQHH